jgi:hypothetical protein
MMFIVTGPAGQDDAQVQVVEAPTADDAAIGVGMKLGLQIDGQVTITNFRDPLAPREYRYVKTMAETGRHVYITIEPTQVVQVAAGG